MLKLQNIKKSFYDNCVLKGIDLDLPKGGVTALIGPSGSGKSTLLRCVNCLVNADDGQLTLDGKTIKLKHITSKDKTFLRRNTAMVFQNFNLFNNKTVIENIIEGLIFVQKKQKDEAREIALELLKRISLKEKANASPLELSGGQQQRVAIARAIALKPKVLLMDEPTSALDPELINEVLELIKELATQKQTMLIVTHEINFARAIADEVCFLDAGNIIEQGQPDAVIGNPQNYRTQEFLSKVLVHK